MSQILSDREKAVMELLIQGLSITEIGKTLYLSQNTISTYVSRVRRKYGAKSTLQAAVMYAQRSEDAATREYKSWST